MTLTSLGDHFDRVLLGLSRTVSSKRTSWQECPSNTQISLCICIVCSEYLMGALWVQLYGRPWSDCADVHTDLIFAVSTCQLVPKVRDRLKQDFLRMEFILKYGMWEFKPNGISFSYQLNCAFMHLSCAMHNFSKPQKMNKFTSAW